MSSGATAYFRWVLYCLYAVVLTAVLLYVRFPATQFNEYCLRQARELFADSDCSIGRISYAFPLSLRFENVTFFKPGQEKNPHVVLTSLSLTPVSADIFQAIHLRGSGYSGKFSGVLRRGPEEKKFRLDALQIQDMHLAQMKPFQDALGRELSGRLDFSGSYSAEVNRYLAGNIEGKLTMREGRISLLQPIFALSAIDLSEMSMEIKYDKQKLRIEKGKLNGTEMAADFSGTINIISPWQLSPLTTAGDIVLQPGFMQENPRIQPEADALKKRFKKSTLPFRVNGNLRKPAFRFGT